MLNQFFIIKDFSKPHLFGIIISAIVELMNAIVFLYRFLVY